MRIFFNKLPGDPLESLDSGFRSMLGIQEDYAHAAGFYALCSQERTIYKVLDQFTCSYIYFMLPEPLASASVIIGPYLTTNLSREQVLEKSVQIGVQPQFLSQTEDYYNLILSSGSCQSLSIKQGSRSVLHLYRNLRPGQFLSLLKDPRTGVKSVCPFPSDEPGRPVILHETIPESVMTAARLRAKESGTTVNDLLIAACYHAYAALPGVDAHAPMSVMSMFDLRRHCPGHDSEGLGNLSGSLPTALMKGISGSFEETLADIAAQTLRVKSDPLAGLHGMPLLHIAASTAPLRLVEMAASRLYGSMSVGLTNLGNIDCGQLAMSGVSPDAGWFAGPLKKKPGMQVSAASFGGACALCIAGCYADEDISLLQALLRRIAGIIKDYSQI